MRWLLIPFLIVIELLLMAAALVLGYFRPKLGIRIIRWSEKHLPDLDWYSR